MARRKKKFIDQVEIQKLLSELHMAQLVILLERMESGTIEPQEMRLIWDMVKEHHIGIESMEDRVEEAMRNAAENVEDIEIEDDDEGWAFDEVTTKNNVEEAVDSDIE